MIHDIDQHEDTPNSTKDVILILQVTKKDLERAENLAIEDADATILRLKSIIRRLEVVTTDLEILACALHIKASESDLGYTRLCNVVVEETAFFCGVDVECIQSRHRSVSATEARTIVCVILKDEFDLSPGLIARNVGFRSSKRVSARLRDYRVRTCSRMMRAKSLDARGKTLAEGVEEVRSRVMKRLKKERDEHLEEIEP